MKQQNVTPEQSLGYQKEIARRFVKYRPDVEIIRFTSKGSRLGSGEWAAGGLVTIGGREYRQVLGTHGFGGENLPDVSPSFSPVPVTVHYNNGTSEVIK